jgi:Chaperone of endosialidase
MKTAKKPIYLVLMAVGLTWCALSGSQVLAADGGLPNGNTSEGDNALSSLTSGAQNTAMGFNALRALTTGAHNTATGFQALVLDNGSNNTATGYNALQNNSVGNGNTASGEAALFRNTRGNNNTATGVQALNKNQSGSNNTATGVNALFNNTASNNTATGASALFSNVEGTANTAIGFQALQNNDKSRRGADLNTAVGASALSSADVSIGNTAVGAYALTLNVNGTENTAVGVNALYGTTGSRNVAVGRGAGSQLITGDDNIYIANEGLDPESGTIRIGSGPRVTATFIAGIYGQSVDAASGVPVQIDSNGKLGTVLSSARFKQAIKPMDKVSEAVLGLEPVTFQYKPELDPKGVPQFGLVAEQVERVAPQLVVHDKQGKPYTVRYEAVNAMLLNEFLKEHRKVEQLQRDYTAKFAQQQRQIEALTTDLQKVNQTIKLNRPAARVVKNSGDIQYDN